MGDLKLTTSSTPCSLPFPSPSPTWLPLPCSPPCQHYYIKFRLQVPKSQILERERTLGESQAKPCPHNSSLPALLLLLADRPACLPVCTAPTAEPTRAQGERGWQSCPLSCFAMGRTLRRSHPFLGTRISRGSHTNTSSFSVNPVFTGGLEYSPWC